MGKELFHTVIDATGLPQDPVAKELGTLLSQNGKSMENMTLEDLREVMAEYLQIVLLEAKEHYR